MSSRRAVLAVAVMLCTSAVSGCGTGRSGGDDGKIDVVAAFYPLFEAAARVGGDRVEVANLTPAGAEPHDLELGTRAVDRIEDANLVLYVGGGFQPAIEEVVDRRSGPAIDLLAPDTRDPHVWLDPRKLVSIVERVRDALVELDPGGSAAYRRNAGAYAAELTALDGEMEAGLVGCERRVIVTAHEAFGHLADRYDLEEEPITGLSPEAEPDPARLAALADDVAARGVTTIFTEALVAPDVGEALAREAGVRTAVLDPLEGLSKQRLADGDSYATVMRENLAALRRALGCP